MNDEDKKKRTASFCDELLKEKYELFVERNKLLGERNKLIEEKESLLATVSSLSSAVERLSRDNAELREQISFESCASRFVDDQNKTSVFPIEWDPSDVLKSEPEQPLRKKLKLKYTTKPILGG